MRYNRAYQYGYGGQRRYGAPIVNKLTRNKKVKIGDGKNNAGKAFGTSLGMSLANKITMGAAGYGSQVGGAVKENIAAKKAQKVEMNKPSMDHDPEASIRTSERKIASDTNLKNKREDFGKGYYDKYSKAYKNIKSYTSTLGDNKYTPTTTSTGEAAPLTGNEGSGYIPGPEGSATMGSAAKSDSGSGGGGGAADAAGGIATLINAAFVFSNLGE